MKNERGFGLIEVIIAIALLGIISVAFLGSLSMASKGVFISDERATAESLARSQMEHVKSQPYINYSVAGHDDYELITPPDGYEIEPIIVEEFQDGLQKVTVTVEHLGKGEIIILESYKAKR